MSRAIGFVIGLVVGATMGWVLGIISAPQSGRDTREFIGERAIELHGQMFGAGRQSEDAPAG